MEPNFAHVWHHGHFPFCLIFSKMFLWNSIKSIIVLSSSTSSSSKTNLLKPLAILSPLVLFGRKITNITDNRSCPNQSYFWLKEQKHISVYHKLTETFNIECFSCNKRAIHITKVKNILHCQYRKILYSCISHGQVCHACMMNAVLFSKGEGIVKKFYWETVLSSVCSLVRMIGALSPHSVGM